jgi:glycosyltransferase involved in cell wall biosynthesis
MRVLFVSPVGVIGGAERSLLDSLWALKSGGTVEPSLLCFADGPLVEQASSLGVDTSVVALPSELAALGETKLELGRLFAALEGGVRFSGALRRRLLERSADIVHTNGVKAHVLAGFLLPPRVPLVLHVHDYLGERPLSRRILPWLRFRRARAVAVSRSVADDFACSIPGVPVDVVHNAVDLERFCPGEAEPEWLEARSGSTGGARETFSFGLVATYADWKGQDVFIRAVAEMRRLAPDAAFRAYIVGGPIYSTIGSQWTRQKLEALAAEHGVSDRIRFVPFEPRIERLYRSLDVVVHASTRREAFGLTIAEAMACGRPVVAARHGGAAELFDDGRSALGVAPGDAEGLARALLLLRDDPARRRELGEAARAAAIARFDRRRLAGELEILYRKMSGDTRVGN